MKLKKILAAAAALSLTGTPAWPELTRIGGAAAVRGSVNAVAPDGKVGRVIESGKPLYLNDHVTTKGESRLQVLLLDESVFTLGPNSDMVLDEFVYDPGTGTGKVLARLTKGIFRFVTGKVARQAPGNMRVNVPTGTIGIRGTKAAVEVGAKSTLVILEGAGKNNTANETPGKLEVAGKTGDSQMLTKEGFGSELPDGGSATPPIDHTADLARMNADLSPKPTSNTTPGNGTGGGKGGSATSETGGVIGALSSLGDTKTTGQESTSAEGTTTQAAQQSSVVADGATTWDFIRQNITNGTGFFFSGHSTINCSGGGCLASTGLGALQLYIDFGAQTLGGSTAAIGPSGSSGSFIHMHNIMTSGDTIEQLIGSGGSGLNPIAFPTSGTASLTLQSSTNMNATSACTGSCGNFLNGNFNGSTVTLENSGGVVAKTATVNLSFSGSNSSSSSVNASGTFPAPR